MISEVKGEREIHRNIPSSLSVFMSFLYYANGRLSSVSSPDGSTSLTYNGESGQLVSIQSGDGTTNGYTYDGFLPLSETWSGAVNGAVTRTFNNDFQLASVSISGGTAIPYTYDNDGLLTGVGGLTLSRGVSNGLLESATLGSVTDTYAYNSFGEVSTYTAAYPAGLSCQITYTRDAIGRITGKTEAINGITTTWEYTYDTAGRLTQTTKNGDLWASYGYDSNGNRLTKTTSSQTINGTYDAQDRLLSYGNYTYTYTANGELRSKTNTTNGEMTSYTYDVLGNLRTVLLPDGTQIDYIIDGRNRRVGKKVNGTLERSWIYDGQLRPVAELDGSGVLTAQYVYATHINVPDYIIKGATTYRAITDHLGSLRFVIDTATGAIVQRMDYDDWGNVLVNTSPDFTPFGFAGGLYDSQTKLTRFGARDYDPECGRWTAKDPIGFGGVDYGIYSYAKNNPVCLYDPTGRNPLLLVGLLAGLLLWDAVESLFESPGDPVQITKPSCGGPGCHNMPPPSSPTDEICIKRRYHYSDPKYQTSPYIWVMSGHMTEKQKQAHDLEHPMEYVPPVFKPLPAWGQPKTK
ncbi:MAG TPA: RHS repeat-associated core domain-containing protein [Acidobacteriota bacterium]|nr:RHS repeat-associated core domain-containing protein [Acidobacteriota bacterium]